MDIAMMLAECGLLVDFEEAVWTAAMMNDLPDSAFLYIEPGAEKDDDGKTKPRSKRHFPVMGADGKVDLPHLRNALARIPQSKLDDTAKGKAMAKAQKLAAKHLPSYQAEADRLHEAEGLSFEQIREMIRHALRARLGLSGNEIGGPWVTDVYDDYFIYENNDKYFQASYAIEQGNVTFGDPTEVERKIVFEPVKQEAARLAEGLDLLEESAELAVTEAEPKIMHLAEKAVGDDGSIDVKVIDAGWGSSGYYSKEMLERDAPTAWPAGTKMYLDHPTLEEERQRPERSLRDLAAQTTGPAVWDDAGWDGPGVYAPAKVFAPFQPFIEEYGADIGISHRSLGKAVKGQAEGRKGPIIEKIVAGKSIDFVTMPGRGGKIRELFEAAGRGEDWLDITEVKLPDLKRRRPDLTEALRNEIESAVYGGKGKEKRMSEERIAELEEANRKLTEEKQKADEELGRLREGELLRQARDFASERVGKAELPDVTKTRLVESLAAKPALKEGKLDPENYLNQIDEAIKAERDYIATITESGKIKGMGGSQPSGEQAHQRLVESYMRTGLSQEQAEIAAKGR